PCSAMACCSSEETLPRCWAGSGGGADVTFAREALTRRLASTGWCDSLAKANLGSSQPATTSTPAGADFLHGGVVVATPAPPLSIHMPHFRPYVGVWFCYLWVRPHFRPYARAPC